MKNSIRNRGSILWVALVGVIFAIALAMSMLQTTVSNAKAHENFTARSQAFFSTHGATELVLSDYWGRYNKQPQSGSSNFLTFLNNEVSFALAPSGDTVADDFRQGPPSYSSPNGTTAGAVLDTPTKVYRAVPTKFNNIVMGDRMITSVRLYKKERPQSGQNTFDLLILAETQRSLGTTADAQNNQIATLKTTDVTQIVQPQWESQNFTFSSAATFPGFDYAFLTKNISCVMCHLHVRNRARVDNLAAFRTDPTQSKYFGTFERVKVGVTESATLRESSMYSLIEGTFYQRGTLQSESGNNPISAADFMSDTAWTVAFNPGKTTVKQDPITGDVFPQPFLNQTTDSLGRTIPSPAPGGNCYLFYSATSAGQTDGPLPTSFPAPFPEIPTLTTLSTGQVINGPNSKVDPAEVAASKADLVSYVDPALPSTLSGGYSVTLPMGVKYTNNSLPSNPGAVSTSAGNVSPAPANVVGSTTGNMVLTGTATNPIVIDGKIVIDGDLMLRGYVQGTGQLYVTGNIYLPADVIYNNKNVGTINETFGKNSDPDPRKQNNLVGLIAGKNIVMGQSIGDETLISPNKTPWTLEQLSILNRQQLMKSMTRLPTSDPTASSSYAGTAGVANPNYDPNFIPRFYSYNKYDPANPTKNAPLAAIYSSSTWDTVTQSWNGAAHPSTSQMTSTDKMPAGSISAAAREARNVINIQPDWIDPLTMWAILGDEEKKRVPVIADPQYGTAANGYKIGDLRIDGVLYTNNALFTIEKDSKDYYNPSTKTFSSLTALSGGHMQVNGAVVAPDTGVLVTGSASNSFTNNSSNRKSFMINYDARGRNFISIKNQDFNGSSVWTMTRYGMSRGASFAPGY